MTLSAYLQQHGYTVLETLAQDGGLRSYTRVQRQGQAALCMNVGRDTPSLERFLLVQASLAQQDIRVPAIYDADLSLGLALIEDLGDTRLSQIYKDDDALWYGKAFDLLTQLRSIKPPADLQALKDNPIYIGRRRLIDWYAPAFLKRALTADEVGGYFTAWDAVEAALPAFDSGFVHADFHLDNLMVLKDGTLAVIDFQDAVLGDPLYDLGNVLEDMRIDVPADVYAAGAAPLGEEARAKLRYFMTMFHCRLLGQCLRWALVEDKHSYLSCLPRLEAYMRRALQDPLLSPLVQFFTDIGLDFTLSKDLNVEEIRRFIADDAY